MGAGRRNEILTAPSEPITISARSAVQEVECGIASGFSLCCIVGRWQVDQEFLYTAKLPVDGALSRTGFGSPAIPLF